MSSPRALARLAFAALIIAALPGRAEASQIVVQEVQATGDAPPKIASALNGILLGELGRIDGMSVISQADVRALLALEANKQMLGCNETSCLTEIAGSLGAELLVTSTLSRLGESWVVAMTLIRVEKATVVRRSTGQAKGGDELAAEAVIQASHELFRDGLPSELQGPAAMTQRGFKAALAGYYQAVLDPKQDPKATRRRIVLDLVQTELDYDATPKIEILDLEIRRAIARIETSMLVAKDAAEVERRLQAVEQYIALSHDLGRVKEIRTRARERGMVPSSRPLRFEDPEPRARVEPSELEEYRSAGKVARELVQRTLEAYQKNDAAAFIRPWKKGYEGNARRELDDGRSADARYGYTYDLLPLHAVTPALLESARSAMKDGKMVVFLRRYKKGAIEDSRNVWLEREGSEWRISSW